ncbi:Thiamine biosynthesis lipoprotein ApbE precursor [compost metagenome]
MRLKLPGVTGIATSSRLKRSWTDNKGTRLHHIIDPRTLRPSQSDLVQVTVWGPSLTAAEVYAKCVLILGSIQGQSWLEQNHPQYSAIGVSGNGRIMAAGSIDPVLQ